MSLYFFILCVQYHAYYIIEETSSKKVLAAYSPPVQAQKRSNYQFLPFATWGPVSIEFNEHNPSKRQTHTAC